MTFNLFDLTHRVASELGALFLGTATGGTTQTIVDTVYLKDRYQDDDWNAGTAWILHDAAGAGAAPEGEYKRVSDFASGTGVITLESVLTAAVASGDKYGVADDEFTIDILIKSINEALERISVPIVDTTTIDTATEKTEYDLPAAVLDQGIRVWIQREDTTGHNQWQPIHGWYIQQTATGTAKKLVFMAQPDYTWDLKIEYWIPHPRLYAVTDEIFEGISVNYLTLAAAKQALLWKLHQDVGDPNLDKKIAEMDSRMTMYRGTLPERNRVRVKLGDYGFTEYSRDIYD